MPWGGLYGGARPALAPVTASDRERVASSSPRDGLRTLLAAIAVRGSRDDGELADREVLKRELTTRDSS